MGRYVVAGVGAVGARAARQVHSLGEVEDLAVVGSDRARVDEIVAAIGPPARRASWAEALDGGPDAVILATGGRHTEPASAALGVGAHVVSTADGVEEVEELLALDAVAREAGGTGRHLVVGAGFAPGLSCVLAAHVAHTLSSVQEVRVASTGTGGPDCARHHHRSLSGMAVEWDGNEWVRHPAGSGREQCWFPDPAGAQDCYRAAIGVPLLLHPAFPAAERISARRAASRRDRITARLPMLRRPHKEGLIGALRVEVVGHRDGAVVSQVLGAFDRPGVAAGAVAALAAHWAVDGQLTRPGAGGLAELVTDTVGFLRQLAERGVKAAVFTGAGN